MFSSTHAFALLLAVAASTAGVVRSQTLVTSGMDSANPALLPVGTLVYGLFEDCQCWFRGKVDEFVMGDPSVYTVRWSDDTTTDYFDSTDLDKLIRVVNHAADFVIEVGENPDDEPPQVYMAGTPVYYHFDDDQGWYYGTITDFDEDGYFVEWSDGSSQTYDIRQTRIMVQQAIDQVISGGDDPDIVFDVGTPVRYKFPKNWWSGKITSYNSNKGEYKVTWTDGSWNKYTDVKAVKQMVDQGAIWKVGYEDVPEQVYPIGSLVYTEFSEKFYKGKITDFKKDGTYEVTYSGGDVKTYSDLKDVVEMVNAAADLVLSGGYKSEGDYPNPYPVGTRVYYHFPSGWYNGYVSNYDRGTYKVTWSDWSMGEPDKGLESIKLMSTQAAQQAMGFKADTSEKYKVGTPVYYKFKDGWYNGKITAFKDGWYVVDWEDDTTNQYDDLAQMKQMVTAAQEHSGSAAVKNAKQRYPLGTPVYEKFASGWYDGTVTGFEDGKYEVTWSDESITYYTDIREMVDQANSGQKNISQGATAVIVIAVIVIAAGVALVVIRRKRTGKETPPPPPRMNPLDGSPEKVSGTGEENIADLKPSSSDII